MSAVLKHPQKAEFIKAFNAIARHRHRFEVWRDFVTMAAFSLHNAVCKSDVLEQEYLQIVGKYEKEEVHEICKLFAILITMLDVEPYDVLGVLYMELELGNTNGGQYFTPPEVSELMARINFGEEIKNITKPFITFSEPACGSGGMVLAFVKVMIEHGHDPAQKLWVHCQDIDRLAALMCYLQLALWNIPAVVVVGNTLMMEAREVFYTPQHYLGLWEYRLARRDREEAVTVASASPEPEEVATPIQMPVPGSKIVPDAGDATTEIQHLPQPTTARGKGLVQLDFGF